MLRAAVPVIGALLVLASSCGNASPDPQEVLRQQAAASFEKIDAAYLDKAQTARLQADPSVPTAYELGLYALGVAGADFVKGLDQIPMPRDSKTDAQALSDAATQLWQGAIACQSLIAAGSACPDGVVAQIEARNAADRQLRKDLHLNQSEVPA